jgi:hypothetical protein
LLNIDSSSVAFAAAESGQLDAGASANVVLPQQDVNEYIL